MEQQYDNSINIQNLRIRAGLYRSLLRTSVQNKRAERGLELSAVYEVLVSMRRSIAADLALLETYLVDSQTQHVSKSETSEWRAIEQLTGREVEVLDLFARGCSYNETAELLDCQLTTIQTHAKRIYKKLNVHSRAEAVFEARHLGLVHI